MMKAVLDIGKTNVKLQLVDAEGRLSHSYSRKNTPLESGLYPHADVDAIWQWLLETLASYPAAAEITALIVTTHGATAALINSNVPAADALVLPVLDYEFAGINSCDQAYQAVRPGFSETLSPDLPAGLNLGRQIFWLQQQFPAQFAQATQLLMYPQYWAWRLTGQLVGEVTSLGCHTDLWAPLTQRYSSLVEQCHWQALMPPLQPAWQSLGVIRPEIANATGLSPACEVHVGLHDSNASYLRYLCNEQTQTASFTVVSTGTWTILMQAQGRLRDLHLRRDTLANCDVFGDPIACARFMGGREYEEICQRLGGDVNTPVSAQQLQTALDNLWMVTPDFSSGNGPFGGLAPKLQCPLPAPSAGAIATLYSALMIDQRLSDLQASGAIYIEGAFLKNPLLCALLAQLRSGQPVYLSNDDTGTVQGALLLTQFPQVTPFAQASRAPLTEQTRPHARIDLVPCKASQFQGLEQYRQRWYALIGQ
ncbi:FGGY-family carbohydrate kinase [Cellvibrio fontiphilus]|uniref:FGGY-family carbohydrate kinase n=1 Tax=Cellvibrio fontiphilus TaxID=1815559 RepID=A0ABV7FGQ0_9GAMM